MELKDEFKGKIVQWNGESCSWCKSEEITDSGIRKCPYKLRAMENLRSTVKGLDGCAGAYFRIKVNCDYYNKDADKYNKIHIAFSQG